MNPTATRLLYRLHRSVGFTSQIFRHLPAIVHPKPICGIASHSFFQGTVDASHNGFCRARSTVLVSRDLITDLNAPFSEAGSKAKTCVKRGVVAQRKNGRRGGGRTVMSEK